MRQSSVQGSVGRRCGAVTAIVALHMTLGGVQGESWQQGPPPGPYVGLAARDHSGAATYKTGQPIVGTTYFYWYHVGTGEHVVHKDGRTQLTRKPPPEVMADMRYDSVDWHRGQLEDMMAARIDFAMPVFWGEPGYADHYSIIGVRTLVEAHEALVRSLKAEGGGKAKRAGAAPKIGMFYDTTTLQFNHLDRHFDLTTPEGRDWFYLTLRDFWSLVPPAKWARIDGRPIIFLYAGLFAKKIDAGLFDDARKRFRRDFGTDFYLVRHADWPGEAEGFYHWSGSAGMKIGDHVAALGPGYDETAVREPPKIVDRQGGEFYRHQWENLLKIVPICRPWIVHIETWNEWHEGTDIARNDVDGDKYMRMTAKYVEMYHAKKQLEGRGRFAGASRLAWALQKVSGLYLVPDAADGQWRPAMIKGDPAAQTRPGEKPSWKRHLYFDVDDACVFGDLNETAQVSVTFLDDGGCESFLIQYDSSNQEEGALAGAFRNAREIAVGNTGTWRTVAVELPEVWFCNRTNRADFRIRVNGGDQRLTVRQVVLNRRPGGDARTQAAP